MQVTTRQTYTLTGIEGTLASEGGKLTFREQDGIDYAASTVLATSIEWSVDLENDLESEFRIHKCRRMNHSRCALLHICFFNVIIAQKAY